MEQFFISGCQRSGTTMLRLILESHPSIQCFDEEVGYKLLINASSGDVREFVDQDDVLLVGFKVPRFAEQLTWKVFSDPDYGTFSSFYNDQKVIHVFRDVLDVVASMMRLKASGSETWLDRYGRKILQSQINNSNVSEQFKRKYRILEDKGLPGHLVGALYWEIKNQGYFDLLEQGKPVYAIRYETLVRSPKRELQNLSKFLCVNWTDSMLYHHRHTHSELDENGIAIGETDSRRPIDTRSIGSYRDSMTDEEIHDVRNYIKDSENRVDRVFRR